MGKRVTKSDPSTQQKGTSAEPSSMQKDASAEAFSTKRFRTHCSMKQFSICANSVTVGGKSDPCLISDIRGDSEYLRVINDIRQPVQNN